MSLVRVKRFAQVTIPAEIRRKAHIEQGDLLEMSYDNNRIIIVPKRLSDKSGDWALRFDKALGNVRAAAKRAGINEKKIDDAVRVSRQRPNH